MVATYKPAGRHGVNQEVLVKCGSFVRDHHQLVVLQVLGVVVKEVKRRSGVVSQRAGGLDWDQGLHDAPVLATREHRYDA